MGQSALVHKIYEYPKERPLFMSSEMEEVNRHFRKLEEGQDSLCVKIELMEDALKEVKGAIIGNQPLGTKGLAERMEDVEDRLHELDKKGVMAKAERVELIEDRLRAYDKLLDRGWGASKVVYVMWVLFGGFIGTVLMLVLTKLQIIKF